MKLAPAVAIVLAASPAHAQLALRADAFATTAAPAGLLVLDGATSSAGPLSAEAIVWTAGQPLPGQAAGDVLVMAVRARTRDGRASARLGRFVATLGALRPVQVDGGSVLARLPLHFDVETYAGVPVLSGLDTPRSWDWVAGGRLARRLGDYGSVGIAYMELRDYGRLATEEVGADAGFAIDKHDDVGARAAYDLANPGLAEASASASHKTGAVREEVYAGYTSASHLLPATSLFTVLGDVPAERAGLLVTWRAAPRLDVTGDLGARYVDDATAPAIAMRARLALDDRGAGAVTGELRRDGSADDPWTGARAALRVPLSAEFAASSEVELVVPDDPRGRGWIWPWALVSVSWHRGAWNAATALEALASPQYEHRLDLLFQVGRQFGAVR